MIRNIVTVLVTAVLLIGAIATPASAKTAVPEKNQGWIAFIADHCDGSSTGWKDNAKRAGSKASQGYPLFIRKYDIRCGAAPVAAVRKPPKKTSSKASTVISYARAQIGKWYKYGSAGPRTYDCSGLMVASFKRVGIRLTHQTGTMIREGRRISRSNIRPGDLVFTSSHHVGLYIGGGKMIVAPHSGTRVRIQRVYAWYAVVRVLR